MNFQRPGSRLQRTQAQDPGFPVNDVTVFAIDLPAQEIGPARMHNLAQQLSAELERSPGLPPSGLAAYEPLGNGRDRCCRGGFGGARQRRARREDGGPGGLRRGGSPPRRRGCYRVSRPGEARDPG